VTLASTTLRSAGTGVAALEVPGGATFAGTGLRIEALGEEAPGVVVAGTASLTGGTVRTLGPGAVALRSSGSLQVAGTLVVAVRSGAVVLVGGRSLSLTETALVAGDGPAVDWDPGTGEGPGTVTITGGSLACTGGPVFQANRPGSVANLRGVLVSRGPGPLAQVALEASLTIHAAAQVLEGPLVVGTGGSVLLDLTEGSVWTGITDPDPLAGTVDLTLSPNSVWNVADDCWVEVLKVTGGFDGLKSVHSGGHIVHYRTSVNAWLGGRTWPLDGGGSLVPY
jgi:hypothetical protein